MTAAKSGGGGGGVGSHRHSSDAGRFVQGVLESGPRCFSEIAKLRRLGIIPKIHPHANATSTRAPTRCARDRLVLFAT